MTDFLSQYKKSQRTRHNRSPRAPNPGEVWWVENLDGIKDRPILVVGTRNGDVLFRRCTSQSGGANARDVIEDYMEAGLDTETYVDREVRSIPSTHLVRRLGSLSQYDREKFRIGRIPLRISTPILFGLPCLIRLCKIFWTSSPPAKGYRTATRSSGCWTPAPPKPGK
ncbi:MAG: hypothetical protein IKP20_05555 [Candidatus Methanomethylophilaceae archaeon]|nr:hypothetical protein [Candidatus Methanomethylophilaceae archaeon]